MTKGGYQEYIEDYDMEIECYMVGPLQPWPMILEAF